MKRKLALLLVFTLLMTVLAVPSLAVTTIGERISEQIFALDSSSKPVFDTTDREMLAELIQLFMDVDDVNGLSNAYQKAFDILTASGQSQRLADMGGSVEAARAFATFINDEANSLSMDNFRAHLGLDGNPQNPAGLAAAIDNRQAEFMLAMTTAGADVDKVINGIIRTDKLFQLLRTSKTFHTEVFNYYTALGTMAMNNDRAREIIELANNILQNDIDNIDAAVSAMGELPVYYNGANPDDRIRMYTYLNKYGFLRLITPPPTPDVGGGGGGEDTTIDDEATPLGAGERLLQASVSTGRAAISYTKAMWDNDFSELMPGLFLVANTTQPYSEYTFTLDFSVLKAMQDEGIDDFSLDTSLVDFSFKASAFNSIVESLLKNAPANAAETAKMSFNVKKIVVDQAFMDALPEAQRSSFVLGQVIYEITLTITWQNSAGLQVSQTLTSADLFDSFLTASFPYDLAAGQNGKALSLYYISATGLVNVNGFYDAQGEVVKAQLNHLSRYTVKPVAIPFADINDVPEARSFLEALYAKGIIVGDGKTRIAPKDILTRAQFATMMVQALKLAEDNSENKFTDVPMKAWFKPFVMSAQKANLITGYAGKFNPNGIMSRQDMAIIIKKAVIFVKGADALPEASFSDLPYTDKDSISGYARESVAQMYEMGLLDTRGDNKYAPLEGATRAEAAAIVYKFFNLVLNITEAD